MIKFDKYDFQEFVLEGFRRSRRRVANRNEREPDYVRADLEAEADVEGLSSMELVCLLGAYLTVDM